jgi:uncharacterized membrane protein
MLSGQESDHLTILLISRWELHNAPQPRAGSFSCGTNVLSLYVLYLGMGGLLTYGWSWGWRVPSTPNYLS